MKVKITKTVDVNHLPIEVRKMLDQAKNNLVFGLSDSMNQIVMRSLSSQGEVFFQAIDFIDSFRQDLAALDESMQEIQNILSGYKKAVMPEPELENIIENEDKPTDEWVQEQVAEYEKFMSRIDGTEEVEDDEHEQGEKHEEG
tara:strand:+ start:777 stop:1205 length:429 start_codon:yes stop_codon:yes gene_type:complete